MISFKGADFPKHVMLYSVFFYVRYGVSYCDLEEMYLAIEQAAKKWSMPIRETGSPLWISLWFSTGIDFQSFFNGGLHGNFYTLG